MSGSNMWARNNKIHRVSVNGMPEGPGGITAEAGTNNTYMISNWINDIGHTEFTHGIYCADGVCNIINNITGNISGFGIHLWHSPTMLKSSTTPRSITAAASPSVPVRAVPSRETASSPTIL